MGTALLEDLTELPQPGLELTEVTEVIRVYKSRALSVHGLCIKCHATKFLDF